MSTTNTNNVSTTATATKPTETVVFGTFSGSFKNFASNWYWLLCFYGFSKAVAHKIAADSMSSLGQAMSKDSKLEAAIGKANKEGQGSFKISGKSGLTQHSNAMSIIRVCQLLEKIREEKLTYKPLKVNDIETFLQPVLIGYIAKCEEWAKSVNVVSQEEIAADATDNDTDTEELTEA